MIISDRAKGVSPSPTLAIDAKVKQMKAEGVNIMGFGAGEPDFDTPEPIKQAAISALNQGFTKYTPAAGTLELKQAICSKIKKDLGHDYIPSQVIVSGGAKHSLYNIFQVLCNPGDEILIFTPYWVSYPEMVKLAGGVPVFVETKASDGFRPDPEAIRKAITPRTKGIIVNSPSNPTGVVLQKEDMQSISEIVLDNDLFVVSDEIYDKLVYGCEAVSITSLGKEIRDRTILVNGVSKTYSMTGWRIGYAVGNKDVITAMSDLQSHSTSNPTSIAQKAALAALTLPELDEEVSQMVSEFSRRRDFLVEALQKIPGVKCMCPHGAFYVFPDISELYGKAYDGKVIDGSNTFADLLLSVARVAVVPGSGFGADEHIRLSYATSPETIKTGVERMAEFISHLS